MARVLFEAELARGALRELRAGGVRPRVAARFTAEVDPTLGVVLGFDAVPTPEFDALSARESHLCFLVALALEVARRAQARGDAAPGLAEALLRAELAQHERALYGERERQSERGRRRGYAVARALAQRLYRGHLAHGGALAAADFARELRERFMRADPERFGLRRTLKLVPILPALESVTDWLKPLEPLPRGRGRPRK